MFIKNCIALLIAVCFFGACSEESRVASPSATEVVQIAGKAHTDDDVSIEFHYEIIGGQRRIGAVIVDGVLFLPGCHDHSQPGGGGPSIPHYENCSEGRGIRDVDFTCTDTSLPLDHQLNPDHILLKAEGNEDYLRRRFDSAIDLYIPVPYSADESITHDEHFPISRGEDYFFRLSIEHKARYGISSVGRMDTWADFYHDDNGIIRGIGGKGDAGDRYNFGFPIMTLEPGIYYLRIELETDNIGEDWGFNNEPVGEFGVGVSSFLLQ